METYNLDIQNIEVDVNGMLTDVALTGTVTVEHNDIVVDLNQQNSHIVIDQGEPTEEIIYFVYDDTELVKITPLILSEKAGLIWMYSGMKSIRFMTQSYMRDGSYKFIIKNTDLVNAIDVQFDPTYNISDVFIPPGETIIFAITKYDSDTLVSLQHKLDKIDANHQPNYDIGDVTFAPFYIGQQQILLESNTPIQINQSVGLTFVRLDLIIKNTNLVNAIDVQFDPTYNISDVFIPPGETITVVFNVEGPNITTKLSHNIMEITYPQTGDKDYLLSSKPILHLTVDSNITIDRFLTRGSEVLVGINNNGPIDGVVEVDTALESFDGAFPDIIFSSETVYYGVIDGISGKLIRRCSRQNGPDYTYPSSVGLPSVWTQQGNTFILRAHRELSEYNLNIIDDTVVADPTNLTPGHRYHLIITNNAPTHRVLMFGNGYSLITSLASSYISTHGIVILPGHSIVVSGVSKTSNELLIDNFGYENLNVIEREMVVIDTGIVEQVTPPPIYPRNTMWYFADISKDAHLNEITHHPGPMSFGGHHILIRNSSSAPVHITTSDKYMFPHKADYYDSGSFEVPPGGRLIIHFTVDVQGLVHAFTPIYSVEASV